VAVANAEALAAYEALGFVPYTLAMYRRLD
jgi:hypothetical protein